MRMAAIYARVSSEQQREENTIRRVRREALSQYDTARGDNSWCLGCRAYAWTCHALKTAEGSFNWLQVLPDPEKSLRFTFAIGSIPLRFYRGDPDDPPSRSLAVSYAELRQQRLAFDLGAPIDGVLRIAIETDAHGQVARVTLVEMDEEGKPVHDYDIPLEDSGTKVVRFETRGIDLPAPTIEALGDVENERKDRNAG